MASVVLVTGVSRYMGGLFVRALEALEALDASDTSDALPRHTRIERIIGVDVIPPPHSLGRAEFVRADIRNPMIGKVIAQAGVDTVVHMNVIATPVSAGGRVAQKEINVIGTMQLLAACQKAPTLQRLVVKSSAAVYGSSPRDPAMFTEDMGPKVTPRTGFGKDSIEVEGYVRGFSRRRPDVGISTLRFANIIGPSIRTSMTDFFALPLVPVPLGFDARLQFVHETDASRALVQATTAERAVGNVNVAGDGIVTLLQAAALVGRPLLPVPLAAAGLFGGAVKRAGLADFSDDQMHYLAYGRGLDTTRMREVLGFEPRYTTRAAFLEYASRVPPLLPGGAATRQAVQGLQEAAGGALGAVGQALAGRSS